MRTILVHLNVEVPDDEPVSVRGLEDEVRGALEVGANEDNTPALFGGHWTITLAEEV